MNPFYDTFEHTADLGLRLQAPDLISLLETAGKGLFSLIVENPDAVESKEIRTIRIAAPAEKEYLLLDWLKELLYLFDSEGFIGAEFFVRLVEGELRAEVKGEPMDRDRHHMDHEVKGITYHGLKLNRGNGGWNAEVIVDI